MSNAAATRDPSSVDLAALEAALATLRADMHRLAERHAERVAAVAASHRAGAVNLLHYLALRRDDRRELQSQLMDLGCSSLGRAEAHALDNVERVYRLVRLLRNESPPELDAPVDRHQANAGCEAHSEALLGSPVPGHRQRIMVTAPDDCEHAPEHLRDLLDAGMGILRINGAKGDPAQWRAIADALASARSASGRACRLQIDLQGPGLRTTGSEWKHRVGAGDEYLLCTEGGDHDTHERQVPISDPECLDPLAVGDRVVYDDGKITGRVTRRHRRGVHVEVTSLRGEDAGMKPGKSLSFPDHELPLPTLAERDHAVIAFAREHADLLGLSFVRNAADVATVATALGDASELGLILKVENAGGFRQLPWILLEAMRRERVGVLIARGDLASEVGFERLAEVQEEILWLCEAAHLPAIWATEVFDRLAKTGVPARSEVTDAFMAGRSECVMLNKGPHILAAVRTLNDILHRVAGHQHKKTPWLRRLESWRQDPGTAPAEALGSASA